MLNSMRNVYSTFSKAYSTAQKETWDLLTAVCLERAPLIAPPLNALEKDFQKLLSELEFERSLKSDFEIRLEQDLKQAELLKKGVDVDIDATSKDTAQDFFDASVDELSQLKLASRTTDADENNDQTSLNRKLDKHLILLLAQKLGPSDHFLLPQGLRQDGETLRQTAERIVKESCGSEIKVQFFGNAPSGFYKYKYPQQMQKEKGVIGAKVFIYLARHKSGQLSLENASFKWLDRNELSKELPTEYHNSISQILIDEK